MQKHILLVEDDEAIREMVANFYYWKASKSPLPIMVKRHCNIV